MSLMFEYKPGMSLTDPWLFTVARASTAYRFANDGTVKQVAANVLRDNHYPFGLGSAIRTTLFEPSKTNQCLQSQTLATAPWAADATLTPTNAAGVAPDGTTTATSLIPTAVSGNQHYDGQAITFTASEFVAASCFFKASGYTGVKIRVTDGVTNQFSQNFDLLTGTLGSAENSGGTLVGAKIIPLANGWYWCAMWGSNGTATTQNIRLFVYDTGANASANTSYAGNGTSGVLAWGAQLERNGTTAPRGASSYIPTVAGTVTRAEQTCSTPWPFQTMQQWCYASWYDLGGSIALASQPVVTITSVAANVDPTWCPLFFRNNGKPGASWGGGTVTPGSGVLGSSRNTVAAAAGLATVQPYDFVETFARVMSDASTRFEARINGGAVFVSGAVGPTGGVPFADIASPTLFLGGFGTGGSGLVGSLVGVTCIRIGADPTRITTLAQAAAA